MATNGFSTTGINASADTLLDLLHMQVGGQKRDLVSNLIVGLLISEAGIVDTILNTGKMANSAFSAGVTPVLYAGITFPDGHFMAGFSATMTIDKLNLAVKSYAEKAASIVETPVIGKDETKKAKK